MAEEIEEAIQDAALAPKRVESDGVKVESHSLPDLIDAAKHVAGKTAAKNPFGGIRFVKVIHPGTA